MVASHFGFHINRGKTRSQKRFGKPENSKAVNSYFIGKPNDPFGRSTSKADDLVDNDPINRVEKKLSKGGSSTKKELKTPPTRPTKKVSKDTVLA